MVLSALNPRNRSLPEESRWFSAAWFSPSCWPVFPDDRPSLKLLIPTFAAALGTCDTIRCLRQRWSFYHGAVVVLILMDIMALCMILFSAPVPLRPLVVVSRFIACKCKKHKGCEYCLALK